MSETTAAPAPSTMTADVLVEKFIAVRDKLAEVRKAHAADEARYSNVLAMLEARLLDLLNTNGAKNMRTEHGTFFKTSRTSAKVIDWSAALAFIQDRGCWELLQARVSPVAAEGILTDLATAAEERVAAGEVVLPEHLAIPGVEVTREVSVNVRRA